MRAIREGGMSPFKAGLIGIIMTVLVTLLVFFKGVPLGGGYEVKAAFEDAVRVKPGSLVRVAGVNVGKVTDLKRHGDTNTGIVTMKIEDNGLPLHRDATMKIQPRLFLEGNFFIEVHPGSSSAPELESGATLPITQTSTAVQIDQVLSVLRSDSRENLQTTLYEIGEAFDKGGAEALQRSVQSWEGAFRTTAQASRAFQGQNPGDLARLIKGQGEMFEAFVRNEPQLRALIVAWADTLGSTAAEADNLQAAIAELDDALIEGTDFLQKLDSSLPAVRELASIARPGVRQLPKTLELSVPFFRQSRLWFSTDELRGLARDLRPAINDFSAYVPDLITLFNRVDKVSQCFEKNFLGTARKKIQDGTHSSDKEIYKEFAYGGVGLASASANFTGAGNLTRFLTGASSLDNDLYTYGTAQDYTYGSVAGDTRFKDRQLYGPYSAATPILGSTPFPTKNHPPYAPYADCASQPLPDLQARTGPPPASK